MDIPSRRWPNDARTRTHRSAPGGTDRLRRLPARASSVGSRGEGCDAPCARCLGADDRGRAGGGVPVIYTTPVSRPDGANVVMLPTDLSAETGLPPLTNAVEGHGRGQLPRRNRAAARGLRLPQAPAERLLRNWCRRAASHAAPRHDHHRRRHHQSRRGDERPQGLQPWTSGVSSCANAAGAATPLPTPTASTRR